MDTRPITESEYERLFEALPTPAFVIDRRSKRFLAVNRATLDLYGFTKEEMLARSVADVRPPEGERFFICRVPTANLAHRINVWRHRTKNGMLVDLELTIVPINWKEAPALMVSANDVTERRKAEELLKETTGTLQTILDLSAVAIIGLNNKGRVTAWNKAAERMFGVTSKFILGKAPPEVRDEDGKLFWPRFETERNVGTADFPIRLKSALGKVIEAHVTASRVKRNDQMMCGFTVIIEDISAALEQINKDRESDLPRVTENKPPVGDARASVSDAESLNALTRRHREVLQLIAEGQSTKQIAASLGISGKTVEMHRGHLMARLQIYDIAGLVRYAIRVGLIGPNS